MEEFLNEHNKLFEQVKLGIINKLDKKSVDKLELTKDDIDRLGLDKKEFITNKYMYIKYVSKNGLFDNLGNNFRFEYLSLKQLCLLADKI